VFEVGHNLRRAKKTSKRPMPDSVIDHPLLFTELSVLPVTYQSKPLFGWPLETLIRKMACKSTRFSK